MTSTDLTIQDDQTFWTDRQVAALTQLGVEGATNADLAVFFHQSVRTGLDPFARQIYMIGRSMNVKDEHNQWTKVVKQTIQTGIDGFRLIARRAADRSSEAYCIGDTLWCGPDGIWHDVWLGQGQPAAAKVTVYRAGQAFPAVALFSEYAGTKYGGELTSMWASKGALMLGKCVEALALRKAFPQDLSGLYTGDEIAAEEPSPNSNGQTVPTRRVSAEEITGSRPKRDEPVDADVVEDHPKTDGAAESVTAGTGAASLPPTAASSSEPITKPQLTKLHILLQENGMGDREAGLTFLSGAVGRRLTSSKDLTKAEAHQIIEAEQQAAEQPFPTGEPPAEEGS